MTNADYVILVADEGMRYLAASDAACDLLGYSREELLALSVPDLVVESNASELFDDFLRDQGQSGTITLRRKDRSLVVANYNARTTVFRNTGPAELAISRNASYRSGRGDDTGPNPALVESSQVAG